MGTDGTIRPVGYVGYNVTSTGSAGSITITNINIDTTEGRGTGFSVGDVIYSRMLTEWCNGSYTANVKTELSDIITITVTSVRGTDADRYDADGNFKPNADRDQVSAYVEYLDPTPGNANYTYANNNDDATKRNWGYSSNSCSDIESTIRSLWGIVTQAVGTGAHTFVNSASSNNITVTGGGSGPFTAVAPTSYDNTTGLMEMTIGSHSLTTSDTVTIAPNSMVFTCENDNNTSQKTYPRTSDPAYNLSLIHI